MADACRIEQTVADQLRRFTHRQTLLGGSQRKLLHQRDTRSRHPPTPSSPSNRVVVQRAGVG